ALPISADRPHARHRLVRPHDGPVRDAAHFARRVPPAQGCGGRLKEVTMREGRVLACAAGALLLAGSAAWAHHGWGSYDSDNPLTLTGKIVESTYQNPHGTLKLDAPGKTWLVILAPP